jgi:chaperone required for assembly of F1-ATPase
MTGYPERGMRRFYEGVDVKPDGAAFAVTLDGRTLRTPKKALLAAPTRALAVAVAEEWRAQREAIRPETMPLTRLCNVALDFAPAARAELIAGVVKFAETDLVCHRASAPALLVMRQQALWAPLLAWAYEALDVRLASGEGVMALAQPPEALAALERLAAPLDDFRLTGLAHAASLSGSAVIAAAILKGRLDAAGAFEAAALDDLFALEAWGDDREARVRLDNQGAEFAALARFFAALD